MQVLHKFLTRAIPANVASVLPDSSAAEQQFIQFLTYSYRSANVQKFARVGQAAGRVNCCVHDEVFHRCRSGL